MPTVPLIRRKVIGKFAIFERKPKPKGQSKYLVTAGDAENDNPKDFSRYALAVLWCKAQEPRPVPHVVILIEGGCVRRVGSTIPCAYTILDADLQHDGNNTAQIPDGLGGTEDFEFHTGDAIVDPDRIAAILKAIEKPTTEKV